MLNDIYIKIYQDINFKICLSLFGWKENILFKEHIAQCTPLPCGIVLPLDLIDMIGLINFCVSLLHWLHQLWGKIRRKKHRKDNVSNNNVDFHYISRAGQDIASIYIVCSRQEHILFFLFSHIYPFLKRYQQYHDIIVLLWYHDIVVKDDKWWHDDTGVWK